MSKNKNDTTKHPLQRDSKAIRLFTKVKGKQKGKFITVEKADPRLSEHDDHESHLEQLNRNAVKFLHLQPEVERREYGYDFSGSKGLHPDQYWPGG